MAWAIRCRANEILGELACCPRRFLSLRRAARFLGVSSQPLRDWIRRRNLVRDGPRLQIGKEELCRFVKRLQKEAQPFDTDRYLERLHRKRKRPPRPFEKLRSSRFTWPKGRAALNPKELAHIVGCHPSLITKAIQAYGIGRRRSPLRRKTERRGGWLHTAKPRGRWEITRRAWSNAFFSTLIAKKRLPALPHGELFSTTVVARHLEMCGMARVEVINVREFIQTGRLQAAKRSPKGRNWYVTKSSLKEFRKTLAKNC